MALGDVVKDAGITVPKLPSSSTIYGWVMVLVIGVIVAATLGFFFWWIINFLKYNKKVRVFRKVGSTIVPVAIDKASFERIGKGGDYWCKVKKAKKILPRPTIQMAKNEFWFYEREDGEWINFAFGDFDKEMKTAGAYYVDEDMRLQRLGIQKNLADRFKKITFWDKYGGMIISIVYILVVTVCLVLLFTKMENGWDKATQMASAVEQMAKNVDAMSRRVGGGAVAVNTFIPFIPMWFRKKCNKKH